VVHAKAAQHVPDHAAGKGVMCSVGG
jgi:hypothetical protein